MSDLVTTMNPDQDTPRVLAVHRSRTHSFSKTPRTAIEFVAGLGVEGDAHAGETVRHRSRVRVDPTRPNLRQVHLIHHELIEELRARGFGVAAGALGENVTTAGLDLLALPRDTLLRVGPSAIIRVTGLRNPCRQLDAYRPGLMRAVLARRPTGEIVPRCGIMGVVVAGGAVRPGDGIATEIPGGPRLGLERV